ncbi:MAG: SDR family NAD(P)-dependent oxidoreductase [Myxococcales bacterium]
MTPSIPSIIGLTPFEHPDVGLALALSRAGALGVLELGHDPVLMRKALTDLAKRRGDSFGVRLHEFTDLDALSLPDNVQVVIAPAELVIAAHSRAAAWLRGRQVLAQVRSSAEAHAALKVGVDGLIAKGHEASGQVGEETTFVLLQRIVSEGFGVPVWAQGGIGLHTAAASVAAGAYGVVVDTPLALLEEANTAPEVRRLLTSMDGSETVVSAGYRLYSRLGARTAEPDMSARAIAQQLGASDPGKQFLTLGQDAAFAASFARFASAKRMVLGLRRAIAGHIRQAQTLRPLAPHAPLATTLGTRYPIVQGPMTRVSDSAAFAESVAADGGMPFLALALMQGEEAGSLLKETRARLGSRPWGVGILGFVPPELREHQLALILQARPSAVLIAGGRPSQARPLEEAGITTFLHVPSPGLLDAFLKDGARRFVFEGRECGGHVGPRTSFVLWETMVERLLEAERLDGVTVLFAGGIHDARSASAVAVLAAPLVARGVQVGVLMGTAYLFTQEAVTHGAIGQAFQAEAVLCEETALVETAPGHATRCARTEFVRAFEAERARLQSAGADAQTVWAELEQMNLGRLRMASKGLRREGKELVKLSEEEQHRDGMFMIGQVAALRQARCSVADLHRTVSEVSTALLQGLSVAPEPRPRGAVDIAIVGAACVFPDAPDLESYWSNIVRGHNAVKEVPVQRWDPAVHFDAHGVGEKTPSKWGGFLGPTVFDPALYGIPPRSLSAIDPTQLLALHVARCALEDSGLLEVGFDRERAGVVFGAEAGSDLANGYSFRGSYPCFVEGELPSELEQSLPRLTEDSFAGVLANVISGRVANRLDLRGPNFTADAACASSLAALSSACKELSCGSCDVMIAGGADLHNGIHDYLMFASAHALSPTGQCRTFDANADGITLGEGVAAVVLKRVEDAERDGDRIYAVIKGVGASSDGKALGLTAPRKEGQLRAVERAYEYAGISPAEVGLLEAHGTGTVVGDRTELAALTELFTSAGALQGSCTLGSVKSLIGHTKCAAGMAGLIKAMLAVQRGVLLPTKNITAPNPGYTGASPFVLRDSAAPWPAGRRLAGVSAFGFGGTNFHVVLAEHGTSSTPEAAFMDWPAELFVLRGADQATMSGVVEALEISAGNAQEPRLCDLAASAERMNAGSPIRCAFVASSLDELREKLGAARSGQSQPGLHFAGANAGPVALLFPGQGSQSPGMLAELFVAFPRLRELLVPRDGLVDRLYPGAAYSASDRERQRQAITDTQVAQPTLGMVDVAVARVLEWVGVQPTMLGGHSYGELVALSVAGAFDHETLIALSSARARCILAAAGEEPGSMAAVRAPLEQVQAALAEESGVVVANHNAPDQVVIAGSRAAIGTAVEKLQARGLTARAIPVACAFHSPLVAGARDAFADELARADLTAPRLSVFSNALAAPYPADLVEARDTLASQLALPVRFVEQVEAMHAAGARVFVEAGPGGVLTDLVGRTLRGQPHVAVACGANERQGLASLLEAMARLVGAGVPIEPRALFEGRAQPLELGVRKELSATVWFVDGLGARPLHGELPDFAMRPITKRVALGQGVTLDENDREATVRDFLRTTRELVDAQRDVLLRFLGSDVAEPRPRREPAKAAPRTNGAKSAQGSNRAPKEHVEPKPEQAAEISTLEALVLIVSNRTGYPTDMLDPDVDLEADLGIDSIKRLEIVAALREKVDVSSATPDQATQDAMVEKLAGAKTLRTIAELLDSFKQDPRRSMDTGKKSSALEGESTTPAPTNANGTSPAMGPLVERYVVDVEPIDPARVDDAAVVGRRFAITRDSLGVAEVLSGLLRASGADARIIAEDEVLGETDGLVSLALDEASRDVVHNLFRRVKEAATANARWIMAATALGGRFGHHAHARHGAAAFGGVAGLLKSVARELPEARVRVVDLAPTEGAAQLAEYLLAEILAGDQQLEVGYSEGVRRAPVVARRPSAPPPQASKLRIDDASVVLITGGARGITGQIAIEIARRYRCALELVGRTTLGDETEDAELRAAPDTDAIRRVLISRMNGAGKVSPAAVEAQCRQILAEREVRATLEAIERAGGRAAYHSVDVADESAFGSLIDRLRSQHGRIDGVVHGAGRIEDKLLSDKTQESFARVFATKVAGARTLLQRLASEARFFVFFSSVSSTFGNRGQTDYAAANDALDKLAHWLHGTVDARVLSINWGPWRGIGMVRPELEREYDKRGIGLISPAEGIERFFEELLVGTEPQAILTAGHASALTAGGV